MSGEASVWEPRTLNTTPIATTTELEDVGNAINTDTLKVAGYMVYNTTTSKPVWAVGPDADSLWNLSDSTLAHTPV